jgi:hypothetical protein
MNFYEQVTVDMTEHSHRVRGRREERKKKTHFELNGIENGTQKKRKFGRKIFI